MVVVLFTNARAHHWLPLCPPCPHVLHFERSESTSRPHGALSNLVEMLMFPVMTWTGWFLNVPSDSMSLPSSSASSSW